MATGLLFFHAFTGCDVTPYFTNLERNMHGRPGAKTIKTNTNSTQNKSQTHRAKQYEVTSFLSTDCELSTETCSKTFIVLAPGLPGQRSQKVLSPCHYHTCRVNITEDIILKLERFVLIMYCRTSGDTTRHG